MQTPRHVAKPIIFVNKNANSESFSNTKEDPACFHQINRHAQVYRKLSFRERRGAGVRASDPPIGWLRRPPRDLINNDRLVTSGGGSSEKTVTLYQPQTQSCRHNDDQAIACFKCSKTRELLLLDFPRDLAIEPFGLLTISMNAEKYNILQYFMRSYLPAQLNFYQIPETQTKSIVQGCLTAEIHFYSLLAAATARMKHISKDPMTRPDLPEYFAFRATGMLRQYLLNRHPVTQEIVYDMFLLATAESYRYNWSGVRVHRTAYKYSVAAVGGFEKIDPFICKMLWRGDLFVAAVTITPPILELCWDPGAIAEPESTNCLTTLLTLGVPLMGAGFLDDLACSSNVIFCIIVTDIVTFCRTLQYFWSGFRQISWDHEWVYGRSSALLHRLLSLGQSLGLDGGKAGSQQYALTEECCRLALIIWLFFVFLGVTGKSAQLLNLEQILARGPIDVAPLRKVLTRILELDGTRSGDGVVWGITHPAFAKHGPMLLWILGLGALVAIREDDRDWFSNNFATIARSMGVCSYEDFAATIASRYLWLNLLEEASGRRLARLLRLSRIIEC